MTKREDEALEIFLDPGIAPPAEFDVKREERAPQADIPKKGPPAEPGVHVFMKWPESMKDEFDDLVHRDKALRKLGKNTLLTEWCRDGMEKLKKSKS